MIAVSACVQSGAGQGAASLQSGGGTGRLHIEAIAGYGFGTSIYELSALTPDPRGGGEVVPIRSRLEFPLDAVVAGGRIAWTPGGPLEKWSVALAVMTNLNDPSSKFINSDFVNGPEVIHTESDARLDLIAGNAIARYRLENGGSTGFSLLFRADYQRIDQYIVGYTGWQRSLFSGATFNVSGTQPVLDYRVTYVCPQLGAGIVQRLGPGLALNLDATAGVVFASDFDDHLLRDRTSEGSGTGFGMNATAGVELLPGSLPLGGLSVALRGGITYYRAEGAMDQTFSSGRQYLDIPYLFESFQGNVGLSVAYAL